MSIPQPPKPVKLVVSLFMRDKRLIRPVSAALVERFGPMDVVGSWLPFDFTDYYQPEMGSPLFRRMMAFEKLISQTDLPRIKIATNRIEQEYAKDGVRTVNIDPGYLSHERFVLATGKNFTHRIYLDQGIYADLTLVYTKGAFKALPWTYPDYQDPHMLAYLERVRGKYLADFKREEAKA